jgi:D-xylose transport system substrate-binding protein
VYKDLKQQAGAAAKAAVALANGDAAGAGLTDTFDNGGFEVPSLFLDPIALDLTNIKQVIDDGFVTEAELCTGEVASKCDF